MTTDAPYQKEGITVLVRVERDEEREAVHDIQNGFHDTYLEPVSEVAAALHIYPGYPGRPLKANEVRRPMR